MPKNLPDHCSRHCHKHVNIGHDLTHNIGSCMSSIKQKNPILKWPAHDYGAHFNVLFIVKVKIHVSSNNHILGIC